MSDLLFDMPWWLPVILAAAGIGLFISGNARQKDKIRNGGLGLIGLTIVLMLVSYFVDTDKETAIKQARALVAAVDKQDWPKLASLLDERSTFSKYGNRDELVEGAKRTAQMVGLKSAKTLSVDAREVDSIVTVDLSGISDQDATMGRPLTSSWQLDWRKTADGMFLTEIRLMTIGGREMRDVDGRLPNAK